MADEQVAVWPRPYFKQGEQPTKLLFVCFGKAPLAEVPLTLASFGLPSAALAKSVALAEHQRASKRSWFENWWGGAFGVIAEADLGDDLPLLTTSNVCFTLNLELPDQADLAPQQTVWGLARWLCARGIDVVLDVHAFRFRTRQDVEALGFAEGDVQRDVKLVLESEPSENGAHLMHTRGLCKFGRPELLCFIQPDDGALMGRVLNQLARTLMEGALASQIRLRIADGVELVTKPMADAGLVDSLGLEGAVLLGRADGAPLVGLTRLAPDR
ncbi:MAG TPA: hypothetical protein VHP33_13145 [Polyangiaceae bacterium]|nr:hypothetical protein [Polyangiaceae bacterium]